MGQIIPESVPLPRYEAAARGAWFFGLRIARDGAPHMFFGRVPCGCKCGTLSVVAFPVYSGAIFVKMTDQTAYAVPADQPDSVHEIAGRLFGAYEIDGGNVHLAGCSLDDQLFWLAEAGSPPQALGVYLDANGEELDAVSVEELGMARLSELEKPLGLIGSEQAALIESMARRVAAERLAGYDPSVPVTLTALWCKFVEGKLRFVLGKNTADLPFSGWARTIEAPPFTCPYTGVETFHVAATDDGRIAAAEAIEICQETGARVLIDDLETCAVSGRRAAKGLLEACPVTGQHVLGVKMVRCGTCGQDVSPASLHRNQCAACHKLLPVGKDDPRMARVLHEHPLLDRWHRWRISETATVYILVAAGWFRKLLAVVDKDSLELKMLGTANRLTTGWNVVEPSQHEHTLRQ